MQFQPSNIIQNQTFRVWQSTEIFYQQQAGNHKSEYPHLLEDLHAQYAVN